MASNLKAGVWVVVSVVHVRDVEWLETCQGPVNGSEWIFVVVVAKSNEVRLAKAPVIARDDRSHGVQPSVASIQEAQWQLDGNQTPEAIGKHGVVYHGRSRCAAVHVDLRQQKTSRSAVDVCGDGQAQLVKVDRK